ncbi:MAG TPA: LuxR C-terminal-related transcriptional regulator [Micropruina sp.]|nr:LuxR C-terminal-related transcriptional regulator [Micropruina sp.]
MVDVYTIGRRDARVGLNEGGTPLVEPASVVLDMLCAAMHALTDGRPADRVVCEHLVRGLRADAGVTLALDPDGSVHVVCCHPETAQVFAIAEELAERILYAGEEQATVEHLDDLGHVASISIRPGDPDEPGRPGPGRVLAYVRSRAFAPGEKELLERAHQALVAFWPHSARTVRAHQAQDWVRTTVEDSHMTDRELQVLALLAEGLLATSIASRLRLSPRTVHKHLGNIYRKLGVHDRLVAVSLARLHGLVDAYPSSPTTPGRE